MVSLVLVTPVVPADTIVRAEIERHRRGFRDCTASEGLQDPVRACEGGLLLRSLVVGRGVGAQASINSVANRTAAVLVCIKALTVARVPTDAG